MTTVEVPIQLTLNDLAFGLKQLPTSELAKLIRQMVLFLTQQQYPLFIDEEEQVLLKVVAQRLPSHLQTRLDALRQKINFEPLTPLEHTELLQLVQQVEQQDLQRVSALVELARKRGTTMPILMEELGLKPVYA